jgi:hypothetical protein
MLKAFVAPVDKVVVLFILWVKLKNNRWPHFWRYVLIVQYKLASK